MSTELKPVPMRKSPDIQMTRFWGGKERGTCVQLTQLTNPGSGQRDTHQLMQLTTKEAIELAKALLDFATGTREEV